MWQKISSFKFSFFGKPVSFKDAVSHPMFAGSAIMVFGSNIANFFASIYHFVIGRMLDPNQYGELATTITFISLVITSLSFLSIVVVKFISSSKAQAQKAVISWFSLASIFIGVGIAVLLVALAPFTSKFFHIHQSIMYVAAPIVGLFIVSMALKSILQGLLMFLPNVLSTNVQIITRLALGVIAVYLGWEVAGALVGFLIALVLEIMVMLYYLRNILVLKFKIKLKNKLSIFKYAIPTLFSTFSVNSLISTDVLLAKHHLSSFDAGIYAALSTLGKIIFFGTAPIASVMFPLIAKKYSERKNSNDIFLISMSMTVLVCLGVTFIYFLFPKLVINILYGDKYLIAANKLYLFGIFISVYTIGTLMLNYFLSRDDTKVVVIPLIAAFVQYILIRLYNESILQIVVMSTISVCVMTVGFVLYFLLKKYKFL
ncbi:MAG: oligosaccharide flippase family protein [Patescibacteria group bacterium]|nr:oligosaccharide flippase family protein [Patescibacteria group bacterium]